MSWKGLLCLSEGGGPPCVTPDLGGGVLGGLLAGQGSARRSASGGPGVCPLWELTLEEEWVECWGEQLVRESGWTHPGGRARGEPGSGRGGEKKWSRSWIQEGAQKGLVMRAEQRPQIGRAHV